MTAVVAVPMDAGLPLAQGLKDLGVLLKPRPESGGAPAEREGAAVDEGEMPDALEERAEDSEDEMIPQSIVKELQVNQEKWKQFLQDQREPGEVKNLTLAIPVKSRKTAHIIEALATVYARFRSMQVPIYRIHRDRAKEFISSEVRKWIRSRDILQTATAGDEPVGNSRVEREVGVLKGRARALLKSARAPVGLWPLAVRHASEAAMEHGSSHSRSATLWRDGHGSHQDLVPSRAASEMANAASARMGTFGHDECHEQRTLCPE